MRYIGHPVEVTAIQWTGDNLPAVQAFCAPNVSPLVERKRPDGALVNSLPRWGSLGIYVRDYKSEATYPNLGRQTTMAFAALGDWLIQRPNGEYEVVPQSEFVHRYDVAPGVDAPADAPAISPTATAPAPLRLVPISDDSLTGASDTSPVLDDDMVPKQSPPPQEQATVMASADDQLF